MQEAAAAFPESQGLLESLDLSPFIEAAGQLLASATGGGAAAAGGFGRDGGGGDGLLPLLLRPGSIQAALRRNGRRGGSGAAGAGGAVGVVPAVLSGLRGGVGVGGGGGTPNGTAAAAGGGVGVGLVTPLLAHMLQVNSVPAGWAGNSSGSSSGGEAGAAWAHADAQQQGLSDALGLGGWNDVFRASQG